MSELTDDLLKLLVGLNGRLAFPQDELRQILMPNPKTKKQLRAYNLCDGKTSITEIAKSVGIDKGNLSRTVGRWERLGVVSRVSPDNNPLHIYPVDE